MTVCRLRRNDEGGKVREANRAREYIVHTALRDVEVRMRGKGGDAVREETGDAPAERLCRIERLERAENQRMMGDDELSAAGGGLRDGRVAHIQADEDALDARRRAADEQSRVVPVLREMPRGDLLHDVHDVLTCHHTSFSSNSLIL